MGRRGVLAIPAGTVLNEEKQTDVDTTLADAKAYVAVQTKSKTPLLMGNRQVPPQRQGRKLERFSIKILTAALHLPRSFALRSCFDDRC